MKALLRSRYFLIGTGLGSLSLLCYWFPPALVLVPVIFLLYCATRYYGNVERYHYHAEPDDMGGYVIYTDRGEYVSGPHDRNTAIGELNRLTSLRNRTD